MYIPRRDRFWKQIDLDGSPHVLRIIGEKMLAAFDELAKLIELRPAQPIATIVEILKALTTGCRDHDRSVIPARERRERSRIDIPQQISDYPLQFSVTLYICVRTRTIFHFRVKCPQQSAGQYGSGGCHRSSSSDQLTLRS